MGYLRATPWADSTTPSPHPRDTAGYSYQLHAGGLTGAEVREVVAVLDDLVAEGLVREIGTSVDGPDVQAVFADSPHTRTAQTQANVFGRSDEVLSAADAYGFAVLARSPLAMGLLTGKYDAVRRPTTYAGTRRTGPTSTTTR